MDLINETQVTEFILLGFAYGPQTKRVLFGIFFIIYFVNVAANTLFIVATLSNSQLHTPMYFFLCHLSVLDITCSTISLPTAFKGLLVQRVTITFNLCVTQMYMTLAFGQTEFFLLAVIAWDRYVAICKPLIYQKIMTTGVCINLAIATWSSAFILSLSCVIGIPWVHFCGHNVVDHTICEAEALSRITCRDNSFSAISGPVLSLISLVAPLSVILFTYIQIISTILRMPATESKRQAFATCGSHLVVVILYYGTCMLIYMRPKNIVEPEKDKALSAFYGIVVPAVNPLIYTLRNKAVKGAMRKLCITRVSAQGFSS